MEKLSVESLDELLLKVANPVNDTTEEYKGDAKGVPPLRNTFDKLINAGKAVGGGVIGAVGAASQIKAHQPLNTLD